MALLDNVRERKWADILSSLPFAPPFVVDVSDFALCSENWLANYADAIGPAGHDVFSFPGNAQSYLHDAMLLYLKAEHVSVTALRAFENGRSTWSIVDLHHASLLHAKVLAAFFGLHVGTFRKKSYLVDYFPHFGSKDHRRRFNKDYANSIEPVRIMRWSSDHVEQKDIWKILLRIIAVCGFPDSRNSALHLLSARRPGAHSPERNRILYELSHWTFPDDLVLPSSNVRLRKNLRSDLSRADEYYGDILLFEGLRGLSRSMAFDLCAKFFISDEKFGDFRSLPDACFRCV